MTRSGRISTPRLRRNAAWMASGQGVFAFYQWMILVALARLGGPEEVGRFTLALAVVTPIMLFAGLQMRQIYTADARGRTPFVDYLIVRLGTTALAVAGVVTVAVLGGFGGLAAGVLVALAIAKAVEGLSDIFYALTQRHERLDLVAQSMMIRGTSGLAALAVTFYVTGVLAVGVLAMAAAWAVTWWLFDLRVSRPWRGATAPGTGISRPRRLLNLAGLGLPLGGTLLLNSLNINMPRYFIEAHLGSEPLGIFAAMAYFTVAGSMVVHAVGQAAIPRLATYYARGDLAAFRALLGKALTIAAVVGLAGVLVAWAAGEPMLALVYGAEFARNRGLFVLIMTVGLVDYVTAPFGYSLTAMQRFRVQFFLFLLVVLVNAIGCWLLTPRYGVHGAVWGWLGGLSCQLVLGALITLRGSFRPSEARTAVSG